MSLVSLVMNLLLAGLLLAALMMGWRLNRRLTVLRDSQQGFDAAVRDLNVAAQRAEQGLADLRAATDEATDLLSDRIAKGRDLAHKLERQTDRLERLMESPQATRPAAAAPDTVTERRLGALLAAAREARPERSSPDRPPTDRPSFDRPSFDRQAAERPLPPRRRSVEDDLFDDDEPLTLHEVRSTAPGVRR